MGIKEHEIQDILRSNRLQIEAGERVIQRLQSNQRFLLAALKLLRDPEKLGRWTCYCDDAEYAGSKCDNCVATDAINKAEGVS